jgi:hypothetical protein
VAYLWASEYLLEPAKFVCFHCEEKVNAGAHKENLFCWRFGSHAWPAIHQSEGELVGSLAARAIHEMRLSALSFFYSTLETKTSS